MRKRSRNGTGIVILVLVIGLWLLVWFRQRAIIDWWRLRGYRSPAAITQLATATTMTAQATHDFYVNHPDLESASSFNVHCPAGSEQTIILGCYHSNQAGIFLYNVTDVRLSGVEQVTAAHEMLHAAYDRLSNTDRNYIDGLLENYYLHDLHDPRIISTIAAYKKSEPSQVVNEMHSVFGTEVANLPPALEAYYRRYFSNRAKVVADAASYQSEFISRQNQVDQDDMQLKQLKTSFLTNEADLQAQNNQLETLQTEMNNDKRNGHMEAYNAIVPGYNTKVDAYNAELNITRQLIDQYNQLLIARKAIAVEEQQLEQALSSRLAPIVAQ